MWLLPSSRRTFLFSSSLTTFTITIMATVLYSMVDNKRSSSCSRRFLSVSLRELYLDNKQQSVIEQITTYNLMYNMGMIATGSGSGGISSGVGHQGRSIPGHLYVTKRSSQGWCSWCLNPILPNFKQVSTVLTIIFKLVVSRPGVGMFPPWYLNPVLPTFKQIGPGGVRTRGSRSVDHVASMVSKPSTQRGLARPDTRTTLLGLPWKLWTYQDIIAATVTKRLTMTCSNSLSDKVCNCHRDMLSYATSLSDIVAATVTETLTLPCSISLSDTVLLKEAWWPPRWRVYAGLVMMLPASEALPEVTPSSTIPQCTQPRSDLLKYLSDLHATATLHTSLELAVLVKILGTVAAVPPPPISSPCASARSLLQKWVWAISRTWKAEAIPPRPKFAYDCSRPKITARSTFNIPFQTGRLTH
uniref:Uncharacterized protein n=1 Tax=Timema poppense TaxID=170557 RepID=A0A7R9CS13_TIMPO|nr:unnamed protein product [Timema poppensis]